MYVSDVRFGAVFEEQAGGVGVTINGSLHERGKSGVLGDKII